MLNKFLPVKLSTFKVFSEFGPIEFGLKYEFAEDIFTNYVTYVEKLVVPLKDLHMKFKSDVKPYFIKVFWRHNESSKFKNILSFQRLTEAQKNIWVPKIILGTEIWIILKQLMKKSGSQNFSPGLFLVLKFEKIRNMRFLRTLKRWRQHF